MTSQERNDYIFKWHRFQQRYERIYARKFHAALKEQVKQWEETRNITSTPIYKVLVELYKVCGTLWAAKTGIRQRKKAQVKARMPMGFSERIVALMRQYYFIDLINDAELMTATSREHIATVLGEAAQTGASLQEVVKQLLASPGFNAMRARRIARTETVTASNLGALVNAKESGLETDKEWISITDRRTRHTHRDIDGRIIGVDDYFNLSGVTMQQPGARTQQNGLPVPAGEVVNCRCTMGFITKTDDQGRILVKP